jgi:hypothetical protein
MTIYRAWINQPSTQQPLHDLHGTHCIVNDLDDNCVDIYFTEGDVHSMRVSRQCISRVYLSDAETRVAA